MGKEVSFMNGSKGDIKTILQGLKELDALVKGQTMESFKCDTQKQKAVSYTLIILSRNAAKCCDELMDISMPQVPLRNLAGLHVFLIEQYDRVSPRVLWNTATKEMARLKQQIQPERKRNERER